MVDYNEKEDSNCVYAIDDLLIQYMQAKESNPGSLKDIVSIRELSPDSKERINAEKSQIYIGYKVLWIIRLLLNGKEFPTGDIPDKLLYAYVHQLVDYIS